MTAVDQAVEPPLVYDEVLHNMLAATGIEPDWIVTADDLGKTQRDVHAAILDCSVLDWDPLPDGRHLVVDAGLNLIAVAPGVLGPAAAWVYLRGQCLALAVAVADVTGWPVRTINAHPDDEPWDFTHAVVESPDGDWLDIRGRFPAEDKPGLRIPAEHATVLLDAVSGSAMPPQHVDVAATLVPSLLETR